MAKPLGALHGGRAVLAGSLAGVQRGSAAGCDGVQSPCVLLMAKPLGVVCSSHEGGR